MHKRLACGIAISFMVSFSAGAEQTDQFVGRVVDEKGEALAGAKVLAFGTQFNAAGEREDRELGAAVTEADGRFEFDQAHDAPVAAIVATKEGKCLDWVDCSGELTTEPVLHLGPAAAIEGEIVGEHGEPIRGASVDALLLLETPRLRQMYGPLPGGALTARTDAEGRFRFANVPEAAIVGFEVTAPARARVSTKPRFMPGQKELRFVLPPEGRLEGVVVDRNTGQPLTDVCLQAVGSLTSGVQLARAKTDEQGRFSIGGLSGGDYNIEIIGTGQALSEWLGLQEKVRVETGRVASRVRLEASKGGTLEFSLIDAATGKPVVTAASVHVSPAEDLRIRRAAVFRNDSMARLHLAPGNYVVNDVWITGYSYNPDRSKSFPVEAGKIERVTLALTETPQVAGVVRDLMGRPVSGAEVQVLPLTGDPKDLYADNDGRFAVDSADIGPLFCFISVRHPQQNLAAMEVIEKDEDRVNITLRPPTKVSGAVLDSQGRPVIGARVQAQIDASHLGRFATVAMARTDKDGCYQMELAGTIINYAITARAQGYSTRETLVPQYELVQGPTKVKDFILKAADRGVRGVVLDPQGRPLPGVIVSAKPMGGPRFPASVVTDAKGQFVMEHLTDDPVIYLFATAPGRGWTGDRTIGPGDEEVVISVGPSRYD